MCSIVCCCCFSGAAPPVGSPFEAKVCLWTSKQSQRQLFYDLLRIWVFVWNPLGAFCVLIDDVVFGVCLDRSQGCLDYFFCDLKKVSKSLFFTVYGQERQKSKMVQNGARNSTKTRSGKTLKNDHCFSKTLPNKSNFSSFRKMIKHQISIVFPI